MTRCFNVKPSQIPEEICFVFTKCLNFKLFLVFCHVYIFLSAFLIRTSPRFGYIEDITPRSGYEKIVGKRTNSFNHEQLVAGYIRYVQSEHDGIEPTSDQFSLQVTDGQFHSVEV